MKEVESILERLVNQREQLMAQVKEIQALDNVLEQGKVNDELISRMHAIQVLTL